jgi:hypothetical protein
MAKELRFIDPAFRCEVIISGPAKALYEIALPQFERLKEIKSLGVLAHTNDIAVHRHQHLIGLMRIFNKLCQLEQGKGLPKRFLWSFWCRLCFSQVGHAALGYDSEKAVLLACQLDSSFKAAFRAMIQPVFDRVAVCPICTETCDIRDKGPDAASLWFDDLVLKNRWRQVHLWIAALKLIREPRALEILKAQDGINNMPGFSEAEAFKLLVSPKCAWESSMRNLSCLDFAIRDLAFAGTLAIQLDIDNLVSRPKEEYPDWNLLESLYAYMSDTLYESVQAQTASIFFQRALASLLIKKRVSLDEIFGMDPNLAFGDEAIKSTILRVKAGKEVLNKDIRDAWKVWPVNTYIEGERIPCEIEKKITGQEKRHLSHHADVRVTCLKLQKKHSLAVAMCHRSLADRPGAKTFVKLCRSILLRQYPRLIAGDLIAALYEGLVNRTCTHELEATASRLSKLTVSEKTLRNAAQIVNKRAIVTQTTSGDVSFRIGGFEYPFRGDAQELVINAMHAAIMGDDRVRKNLDTTVHDAAEVMWYQILEWQTIYFGQRPTKKIGALVNEAQRKLALSVVASSSTAEADLEIYTLLEALKHPSESISFRIALPNLKLVKENGTTENEYDVVSVVLKKDKDVEVWIWGATTQSDIANKRNEDLSKIQKLKDLLGNRWGNDVRIATCYIHKDGNDICCEIDGRQERRQING